MRIGKYLATEPMTLQLAPFIDVILFLLTFFLLTWNISRYEAELSVSLPAAKESETPSRMPGEILVNLDRDGNIIVNQKTLTVGELQKILTQVTVDFPDQAIILRADKDTSYQNVINVIDICKAAHVWNIAFTTREPKQNP
ncbi:MAG: biopolymer transporter ExbD [Verrucomicrobiales bacterium]|jgi:biopolymer transport protein ExbD|nr:biopolymer transporter ExbD [Verrucomicrobiales bacterium]